MAEGGITGKGFVKGDPRINRKGRPKSFDAFRELAQNIAHEAALTGGKPLILGGVKEKDDEGNEVIKGGHIVTITEAILRSWATSKDPRLQMAFVEVAYGKPPTKTELTGAEGGAINIVEVRIPKVDE